MIYGAGLAFLSMLLFIGSYLFMEWYAQNHPPEIKVVSLPYTLTYDGMKVTFEKVYLAEKYTKTNEFRVVLKYKNTLHESNSRYFLPGILKLKTDRGNIYEIKEYEPDGYFKPEEEKIIEGYSWINKGEKPVALVYYKDVWGKYLPVLEMRVNEPISIPIAPKFGEVPYLIIKDSSILPSNKVEEWHEMEIINYTMKVEKGWRNKYEIDIDIWIRNTYDLPVDWIEVDVEFINEWNQTYIETDLWSHFIRPNETAKTYIHTAGEYVPQIKEIHVWGHEHHPGRLK